MLALSVAEACGWRVAGHGGDALPRGAAALTAAGSRALGTGSVLRPRTRRVDSQVGAEWLAAASARVRVSGAAAQESDVQAQCQSL